MFSFRPVNVVSRFPLNLYMYVHVFPKFVDIFSIFSCFVVYSHVFQFACCVSTYSFFSKLSFSYTLYFQIFPLSCTLFSFFFIFLNCVSTFSFNLHLLQVLLVLQTLTTSTTSTIYTTSLQVTIWTFYLGGPTALISIQHCNIAGYRA